MSTPSDHSRPAAQGTLITPDQQPRLVQGIIDSVVWRFKPLPGAEVEQVSFEPDIEKRDAVVNAFKVRGVSSDRGHTADYYWIACVACLWYVHTTYG